MIVRTLLTAAVLLALTAPAQAAPRQILLGHAQQQLPANDPVAAAADIFRTEVALLSGGEMTVEILPDGMLGGNRDMTGLVEKGVVHTAIVSIGGITQVHPPLMVLHLPFAFDSIPQARRVLDGPFAAALAADMAARTPLRLMGFVDPGGFHILTNLDRDIRTPDDLWGLNIRAIPGFKPLEAMIRAAGAHPTKVSSREEMIALSSGAVDGQMSPAPATIARGFDTVQGYATLTNHLYAPFAWIFNGATLAGLSPAEAGVIHRAIATAIAGSRSMSDALERSPRGLAGLRKRMHVRVPTVAERAEFRAVMLPPVEEAILEALGGEGPKWVDGLRTAVSRTTAR